MKFCISNVAFLVGLLCAAPAWAAIASDATSGGSIEGNATLDLTHTATGTDTTGLMLCGVATSTGGGTTVSSVTWDPAGANQAFTQITTIHLTDVRVDLWYRKSPTAGTSKTVRIITSAGVNHAAICKTWTGVDLTAPLSMTDSTSGTTSPSSLTPGSAVIDSKRTTTTGGQLSLTGSDESGAAGTTTMSWTYSGTINRGHIAVAIKAPAAAATCQSLNLMGVGC